MMTKDQLSKMLIEKAKIIGKEWLRNGDLVFYYMAAYIDDGTLKLTDAFDALSIARQQYLGWSER